MNLGEKLRSARLEAGLSQRQLCQDIVTRNMLSQIENGSAKPSMKTLGLLAERLGRNISFFLEETAVLSPNQRCMEQARRGYDGGDFLDAVSALEQYRKPDPVYDREHLMLWSLCHMGLALQQLEQRKPVYAKELLEKGKVTDCYCEKALERQRLLLLAQISGEKVADKLPSLDEELLIRAAEAEHSKRAEQLLEAVEDKSSPNWNFLRGKVYLMGQEYASAAKCFHKAEAAYPDGTAPLLEKCYRELGDYKQAYFYACKQK